MKIRNFTIVGHIDHGKTTLTDRLLDLTRTVPDRQKRELFMDQMELERERGITIKAKTIRMRWCDCLLNLIDTPGHVDFSYEVNRALLACEGAVLIVDATQGVQAQTVAHFSRCAKLGLKIIPVINKIDLANAQIEATGGMVIKMLGFNESELIYLSAKTGQGVGRLLDAILERIPDPQGDPDGRLDALVFDSSFDPHRGVIAVVRMFAGQVSPGDAVQLLASGARARVLEVGYFTAQREKVPRLQAGEVGYLVTDLKEIKKCRVGETITEKQARGSGKPVAAWSDDQPPQSVVFADLYPLDQNEYFRLTEALNRLALNDASLNYWPTDSVSLGRGYRCGFLGLLHTEIVIERLRREHGLELVVTEPRVEYRLQVNGQTLRIERPDGLPFDQGEVEEPIVKLMIYCQEQYLSAVMKLLKERGGIYLDLRQLGSRGDLQQVIVVYQMPLRELIRDFDDELKSVSSGYASFEYEPAGWQTLKVVKLRVVLNQQEIGALARIIPEDQVQSEGRRLVERLKEAIPKHQFAVPIQAVVGGKIVARETLAARRKDVTAPLYGGDVTRKRKLLDKQKRGKKRLKQFGRVSLPPEAFRL